MFRCLDQWTSFFGQEADFLSADMAKADLVIKNMNTWGTCLEMFAGSYPLEEIGWVFLEICKFCVPLLQPEDSQATAADGDVEAPASAASPQSPLSLASRPVYIFVKGADSQLMVQAQEKLTCNIAGSIFVQKITKASAPTEEGASKKRARVPDLEEAAASGKKKRTGKAKAKPAPKRAAKESDKFAEAQEDLEANVSMPLTGGQRQRKWLDDVLAAVRRAIGAEIKIEWESQTTSVVCKALAVALRFAFCGGVNFAGKYFKEWSKAGGMERAGRTSSHWSLESLALDTRNFHFIESLHCVTP